MVPAALLTASAALLSALVLVLAPALDLAVALDPAVAPALDLTVALDPAVALAPPRNPPAWPAAWTPFPSLLLPPPLPALLHPSLCMHAVLFTATAQLVAQPLVLLLRLP